MLPYRVFPILILLSYLPVCFGATNKGVPLRGFEQNQGQSQSGAQFVTRQGSLILRAGDSSLDFAAADGSVLSLSLLGAKGKWVGEQATGETVSYQIGKDPSRWVTDAPKFARLRMKNAVPGVDWIVYWSNGKIEYDFLLDRADRIASIELQWQGVPVAFRADGRVEASLGGVRWTQHLPRFFQGSKEYPGALLAQSENRARFRLDGTLKGAVRIDPVIEIAGVIGGEGEEKVALVTANYVVGTTRSQSWEGDGRRSGSDVFVRYYQGGNGYRTVFWGGSGDEELNPAVALELFPNASRAQYVGGWTNSRDLPIANWYYGGGESDGLILSFDEQGRFAPRMMSTEHTERITAVVSTRTYDSRLYYAGDIELSGRPGSRGFVALTGNQDLYWIGEGNGKDHIRSIHLLDATKGEILFAGDTETADMAGPHPEWHRPSGARDAWIGLVRFTSGLPELQWQGAYGGSANEEVAGMISLAGHGLFVAGTTNSHNLTLLQASQEAYGGGATDGFLLRFSSNGTKLTHATYWGGGGADRVEHVSAYVGDLLLSGSSDSKDLPMPPSSLTAAHGGLDGVLATFDSTLRPYWGARIGGPGKDRIHYAAQMEISGPLHLAGITDQSDWVSALQPELLLDSPQPGGGNDAFLLRLRAPILSAPDIILGNNLQTTVTLQSVLDSSVVGTVRVESANPELVKLGYGDQSTKEPFSSFFLYKVGQPLNYNQPGNFAVHSMGGEGSTEIILSAPGIPERRLRVQVVPSAIYPREPQLTGFVGSSISSTIELKPIDPDTSLPSETQRPRAGLEPTISFVSSDESAVRVRPDLTPNLQLTRNLELQKVGNYELIPSSPYFATGAVQKIRVWTAAASENDPSRLSNRATVLGGLTSTSYFRSGIGEVTITSEDPSLILVSRTNFEAGQPSIVVESPAGTYGANTYFIQAIGKSGSTRLIFSEAKGVTYTLDLTVVPSSARININPRVPVLSTQSLSLSFVAIHPMSDVLSLASAPLAPEVPFLDFQCTRGRIVSFDSSKTEMTFSQTGPARCSLSLPSQKFASPYVWADFTVVPQSIYTGGPEILIPEGMESQVTFLTEFATAMPTRNLRYEYSNPGVAEFVSNNQITATVLPLPTASTSVVIRALGKVGDRTMLRFTDSFLNGLEIPVRIISARMTTELSPVRITASTISLTVSIEGDDGGKLVSGAFSNPRPITFGANSSDPQICTATETVKPTYGKAFQLPIQCMGSGEVTIRIFEKTKTLAMPELAVRLISGGNPAGMSSSLRPVILAPNLQVGWSLFPNFPGAEFQLRSLDPSLILISTQPGAMGKESVQVKSNYSSYNPIYIQARQRTGETEILVESTAGPSMRIPVRVGPATIVFRTESSSGQRLPGAELSLEQPGANVRGSLRMLIAPIDPVSGEVETLGSNYVGPVTLTPETEPFLLRIRSAAPEIVQVEGPSPVVRFPSDSFNGLTVNFSALSAGTTYLEIDQPEGYTATPASKAKINVRQGTLSANGWLLVGRGFESRVSFRIEGTYSLPNGIKIRSLNPDALLVSSTGTSIGTESASLASDGSVYLQAVMKENSSARYEVSLERDGWEPQTFSVYQEPLALGWSSSNWSTPYHIGEAGQALQLRIEYIPNYAKSAGGGLRPLPGRDLEFRIRSSREDVVSFPSGNRGVINSNGLYASVPIQFNSVGEAEVSVEGPADLEVLATPQTIRVIPWSFEGYPRSFGRGTVSLMSISLPSSSREMVKLRVSPESGFRLGSSATTALATELSVQPSAYRQLEVYVALSNDAKNGELYLSSPGYTDGKVVLSAVDATFFADASRISQVSLTQGTVELPLQLGCNYSCAGLSPLIGPIEMTLSTSAPGIAKFRDSKVTWMPGDSIKNLKLDLSGAGAVVLRISVPAFGTAPAQTIESLINVR